MTSRRRVEQLPGGTEKTAAYADLAAIDAERTDLENGRLSKEGMDELSRRLEAIDKKCTRIEELSKGMEKTAARAALGRAASEVIDAEVQKSATDLKNGRLSKEDMKAAMVEEARDEQKALAFAALAATEVALLRKVQKKREDIAPHAASATDPSQPWCANPSPCT